MLPISKLAATTARVAVRILRGEGASAFKVPTELPFTRVYDWRELKRWGISEARLLPGSVVRFRQRTFWQLYRGWIVLGLGLSCAGAAGLRWRYAAQPEPRSSNGQTSRSSCCFRRRRSASDCGRVARWARADFGADVEPGCVAMLQASEKPR